MQISAISEMVISVFLLLGLVFIWFVGFFVCLVIFFFKHIFKLIQHTDAEHYMLQIHLENTFAHI